MKYLLTLTLLLISLTYCVFSDKNDSLHYPLILIPGDGGSRAYSHVDYKLIKIKWLLWVNFEFMLFPGKLTEYFSLIYNPTSRTTKNVKGSDVFFPGWGDTKMIEELDDSVHKQSTYFSPLVRQLVKNKFYVRNSTLRGTPYDFRKAPNENLDFVPKLKKLIEETFKNAGSKKRVVILGHSLGSLYSLFFFNQMTEAWKNKYIQSYVSVSSPLGGAVKALKLMTSGDSIGSPRDPMYFREMQRSFPSSALLLPQATSLGANFPVVLTPGKNYKIKEQAKMFVDIKYKYGPSMVNDTWPLMYDSSGKDIRLTRPTGISEVYCIHGSGIDTPRQLLWKDKLKFPNGAQPTLINGDGDGTVNIESLSLCRKWKNTKYHTIDKADHMGIVDLPKFYELLEQVLTVNKKAQHSYWMSRTRRDRVLRTFAGQFF